MSRSVPEWIGKNDDEPAPPRVRVRVFERFGGICQETGLKIQPGDQWVCDHEIALINGGSNRESNLRPILRFADKVKTAADVTLKSKIARVRSKHLGIHEPRSRLSHPTLRKKLNGEVVPR